MRNIDNTVSAEALASSGAGSSVVSPAPAPAAAPEAPEADAKPKRQRKAKAAPAAAAKPAPSVAKPADDDNRGAERAVAAAAVAAFYSGRSLPFKSASDRFADLRLDKPAKAPTLRQAALIAAMLTADTAGNIQRDGTFTRGGFRVPAKLVFGNKLPNGIKPDAILSCQPETGCLSDMLGRAVSYVSGPTTGKAQRDTVLRLDFSRASAEISQCLGDKLGKLALARLVALGYKPPKLSKAA